MGTAGGQPTVGAPQTRPRLSYAGDGLLGGEQGLPDGEDPLSLCQGQGNRRGGGGPVFPQGGGNAGKVLRGVFRRSHEDQEVPVRVLAFRAAPAEAVRQVQTRQARRGSEGQAERVGGFNLPAVGGKGFPQGLQAADGLRQPD